MTSLSKNSGSQTKAEAVYTTIKGAILRGDLEGGQLISTNKLARELGVARNAVRESIARLRAEGFVRNEGAYSRTYVEDTDIPAVIERYELRECVEGMAARLAANHMNSYQVKQLQRLAEAALRDYEKGSEAGSKSNLQFHRYLVANCGNKLVLRIYDMLHLAPVSIHLQKASKIYIGRVAGVTPKTYYANVCDAINSRDGDTAEKVVRERIRIVTEQMREVAFSDESDNEQIDP